MMRYNISEGYSQKLSVGRITIYTDLCTGITYLAYRHFLSSSFTPMVNTDGSYVTQYKHERFGFELLDDTLLKHMPILGQESHSRISYYREWGTGVIYVLRSSFLTANLTPLVKEDGTYLSFEEWEDMHSIEQPSF